MKLLTKALREKLIRNFHNQSEEGGIDYEPVVKLFNPVGAATWLLTELNPETNIAFGLCDLGQGFPELGYVSLDELEGIRLSFGLGIERDMYWSASKTLSKYAEDAYDKGRIAA